MNLLKIKEVFFIFPVVAIEFEEKAFVIAWLQYAIYFNFKAKKKPLR